MWDDRHTPMTRIVSIENTHNSSGGRVWPLEEVEAMAETCRELGLRLHLTAARSSTPPSRSACPGRDRAPPTR